MLFEIFKYFNYLGISYDIFYEWPINNEKKTKLTFRYNKLFYYLYSTRIIKFEIFHIYKLNLQLLGQLGNKLSIFYYCILNISKSHLVDTQYYMYLKCILKN